MKVILIRPPKYFAGNFLKKTFDLLQPPVGIASVYSFLKSKGIDAEVMDLYLENPECARKILRNTSANLVGIQCITGEHKNSIYVAQYIKQHVTPAPFVVLGGSHVSALNFDKLILNNYNCIDFIVRGEGEITTLELIESLEGKKKLEEVKGISFRKNGHFTRNPDRPMCDNLDNFPFPDYSFFNFPVNINNNYDGHFFFKSIKHFKYAPLISSRGCPNRCQFCSLFWGNKIRFRSAENIVAEITNIVTVFGINHFSFFDDCFNVSLERIKKFCQLIVKKKLKVTWTAMTRVKPINAEILKDMYQAGCRGLSFGVESGSEQILKNIGKNITKEEVLEAIILTREAGIQTKMLLMVGNMGETPSTIRDTQLLIKKCKPEFVGISPLIILPNSQLYEYMVIKNRISDEYWLEREKPPFYTEEHSYDMLRYYRYKLLSGFYFSKSDFLNLIKVLVFQSLFLILIKLGIEADSIINRLYAYPLFRILFKKLQTSE